MEDIVAMARMIGLENFIVGSGAVVNMGLLFSCVGCGCWFDGGSS